MVKFFYVPQSIKIAIDQHLEQVSQMDSCYHYYYVIHRICWCQCNYEDYCKKNGISINSKKLSNEIFHHRCEKTTEILKNLKSWRIIEVSKLYYAGMHSTHYKLVSQFDKLKISMLPVSVDNAPFVRSLFYDKGVWKRKDLVTRQLEVLKGLSLNETGVNYLVDKYPCQAYKIRQYHINGIGKNEQTEYELVDILPEDTILFSILTKDLFVSRPDKDSRIFSNITGLKREYRHLVNLDGRPLLMTDIKNSQILISVLVIEAKLKMLAGRKIMKLAPDFLLYKDLSQRGLIYEAIAEQAGLQDLIRNDRKAFKQTFYEDIFFSKVKKVKYDKTTKKKIIPRKSRLAKAFETLFPTVADAIEKIKANDYRVFAVQLQKKESKIMLDNVLQELYQQGIRVLSLHDAIIGNNEADMDVVTDLINDAFKQRNLSVHLSFDKLIENDFIAPAKVVHPNIEWARDTTGIPNLPNCVKTSGAKIYLKDMQIKYPNSPTRFGIKREQVEMYLGRI